MVRVWFNHWFSTSYRLIELMKEDAEQQIYVIGSNQVYESVIQKVCDEWYQEPALDGEEYLEYCVQFCREHQVQVFVPRRRLVDISRNIERFQEIGVRVMVDDYGKIALLNDKAQTYRLFSESENIPIPEFSMVNNFRDFEEAYRRLRAQYDRVCMKFVRDEGGMSFRKIVDQKDSFRSLRIYPGSEIAYGELASILEKQGEFDDIMVMPYLPGKEISVDCLQTEQGLIAVPREKGSGRHEFVRYDEKILKMCEEILDKVPLKCPCNIQFKIREDTPYLLEINTRMSGGLQMSCLAAGVNIPNIALNQLLGKQIPWEISKKETIVSYIELPQLI